MRNPSGDIVSHLLKKSSGCLKSCIGDSDNFSLGFPLRATPEDKTLLMAAALFLDFMYFENKDKNSSEFNWQIYIISISNYFNFYIQKNIDNVPI